MSRETPEFKVLKCRVTPEDYVKFKLYLVERGSSQQETLYRFVKQIIGDKQCKTSEQKPQNSSPWWQS